MVGGSSTAHPKRKTGGSSANGGGASPPASAFSNKAAVGASSDRYRTAPPSVYREHNPDGSSFHVEDDGAVEGVARGSLPDFTPVFGMVGYSSVGDGEGRRAGERRRLTLNPVAADLCHKLLTVSLAVALVAVLWSQHNRIGGGAAPSSGSTSTGGGSASSCSGSEKWASSSGEWAALPPASTALSRIAFGSCMDQDLPQPHWDTMALSDPNVTILLGDNVYGTCDDGDEQCSDLRAAYDKLADHPSFIGARRRLPMVATLDDHDYGCGAAVSLDSAHSGGDRTDGDGTTGQEHDLNVGLSASKDNPYKDVAKAMFLDFFGVPADDERRMRPDDGVYTSYEWGPPGRRTQLILLDARYSRSEFLRTGNASAPHKPHDEDDESKRMLSELQWSWLSDLLDRPADVRLIASSIQVISDGHSFECWRMVPRERNRLYALLKRRSVDSRILLLSGDRLVGGFYEHDSTGLHEVTSSSLTHALPYGALPPCSERDALADDYDWEQCDEKDPRRIGGFVHENNFGFIEIDWDRREMTVSLRMANTYPAHTHGKRKRIRGVKNAGTVLIERKYDIPGGSGAGNDSGGGGRG